MTTDQKILDRIALNHVSDADYEGERYSIYTDVETTGLNADRDGITSLSYVKIYHDDDAIFGYGNIVSFFNDPGKPIPEIVSRITGITDDMVRGHRIDVERVSRDFQNAELLIAHNAEFDRRFIEKAIPGISNRVWGCSLKDIDLFAAGFVNRKLELLVHETGYFHDAHSSSGDVAAGCHIMEHATYDGKSGLFHIMDATKKQHYLLKATGAPFSMKDDLRDMEYRWFPGQAGGVGKCWQKNVTEDTIDTELQKLRRLYMNASVNPAKAQIIKLSAQDRHSDHKNPIWENNLVDVITERARNRIQFPDVP